MKSGFHPAPFLCLSDSVCAWPGGTFNLINIYLVGTKGFVGLPKDYFLFSFFFFPLDQEDQEENFVVIVLSSPEVLGCQGKWEHANGSISPKSSLQSFLAYVVS